MGEHFRDELYSNTTTVKKQLFESRISSNAFRWIIWQLENVI